MGNFDFLFGAPSWYTNTEVKEAEVKKPEQDASIEEQIETFTDVQYDNFFNEEALFDAYAAFSATAPANTNATESGKFYIYGNSESTESEDTADKIKFGFSASWPSSLNAANFTKGQTISHWISLTHTVDKSIPPQIMSCNTFYDVRDKFGVMQFYNNETDLSAIDKKIDDPTRDACSEGCDWSA